MQENNLLPKFHQNLLELNQHINLFVNQQITNQSAILDINERFIQADHVIVREILQTYSKPEQLNHQIIPQQIKSFFHLLKENYYTIQIKYLQSITTKNQNTQNRSTNILKIQSFLKDQYKFYQQTLSKYLQEHQEDDEKVISYENIEKLIKNLFEKNQYIKIFNKDKTYFSKFESEQIEKVFNQYISTNEQSKDPQTSMFISENEILQFLTFWLGHSSNDTLHVIYARTPKTMKQLEDKYILGFRKPLVLDKQTNEFIAQNSLSTIRLKTLTKSLSTNKNITKKQQNSNKYKDVKQLHTLNLLERQAAKSTLTPQQMLQSSLGQLFKFGCRLRGRIHKKTTFSDMQQQEKTMNLQKFMDFCRYLEINQILKSDLLIELFKENAINRLTLDLKKFEILVKKLISKDKQIINKLINKQKCTFLKKRTDKSTKLISKYSYQLRPVNGKDIQTIQLQLQQKKRQKQLIKKQKQQFMLEKKQTYMSKFQKAFLARQKTQVKNSKSSFISPYETVVNEPLNIPQKKRQQRFNPESLISNFDEEDKLWNQYQTKIWKKDTITHNIKPNLNQSTLENALEKRMEKGHNVLKKIASSNLKYYL